MNKEIKIGWIIIGVAFLVLSYMLVYWPQVELPEIQKEQNDFCKANGFDGLYGLRQCYKVNENNEISYRSFTKINDNYYLEEILNDL